MAAIQQQWYNKIMTRLGGSATDGMAAQPKKSLVPVEWFKLTAGPFVP